MIGRRRRARCKEGAAAIVVVSMLVWATGCESEACGQMRACCAEVEDREAVGKACGELIEGIDDPGSCVGVTQSVVAMLEEKGESVPEVCRLEREEAGKSMGTEGTEQPPE